MANSLRLVKDEIVIFARANSRYVAILIVYNQFMAVLVAPHDKGKNFKEHAQKLGLALRQKLHCNALRCRLILQGRGTRYSIKHVHVNHNFAKERYFFRRMKKLIVQNTKWQQRKRVKGKPWVSLDVSEYAYVRSHFTEAPGMKLMALIDMIHIIDNDEQYMRAVLKKAVHKQRAVLKKAVHKQRANAAPPVSNTDAGAAAKDDGRERILCSPVPESSTQSTQQNATPLVSTQLARTTCSEIPSDMRITDERASLPHDYEATKRELTTLEPVNTTPAMPSDDLSSLGFAIVSPSGEDMPIARNNIDASPSGSTVCAYVVPAAPGTDEQKACETQYLVNRGGTNAYVFATLQQSCRTADHLEGADNSLPASPTSALVVPSGSVIEPCRESETSVTRGPFPLEHMPTYNNEGREVITNLDSIKAESTTLSSAIPVEAEEICGIIAPPVSPAWLSAEPFTRAQLAEPSLCCEGLSPLGSPSMEEGLPFIETNTDICDFHEIYRHANPLSMIPHPEQDSPGSCGSGHAGPHIVDCDLEMMYIPRPTSNCNSRSGEESLLPMGSANRSVDRIMVLDADALISSPLSNSIDELLSKQSLTSLAVQCPQAHWSPNGRSSISAETSSPTSNSEVSHSSEHTKVATKTTLFPANDLPEPDSEGEKLEIAMDAITERCNPSSDKMHPEEPLTDSHATNRTTHTKEDVTSSVEDGVVNLCDKKKSSLIYDVRAWCKNSKLYLRSIRCQRAE